MADIVRWTLRVLVLLSVLHSADLQESGDAQACEGFRENFGVIPCRSWGSLPNDKWSLWETLDCDRLILGRFCNETDRILFSSPRERQAVVGEVVNIALEVSSFLVSGHECRLALNIDGTMFSHTVSTFDDCHFCHQDGAADRLEFFRLHTHPGRFTIKASLVRKDNGLVALATSVSFVVVRERPKGGWFQRSASHGSQSMLSGNVGKYLIFLDAHPDILKDVQFNSQTNRIKDYAFFATLSGRTLVEPLYNQALYNYTWFESGGVAAEELSADAFHGGAVPLMNFMSATGGRLCKVLQFMHPASSQQCNDGPFDDAFWGYHFEAPRVDCLPLDHPLEALLESLSDASCDSVGVLHYHDNHVQKLVQDWRYQMRMGASARALIRQRIVWNDEILGRARQFVERHFQGRPFLAVHWRRGDRASRSAGIGGHWTRAVEYTLSSPDRVVAAARKLMTARNISDVFLATNCAHAGDLAIVVTALNAVQFLGPSNWQSHAIGAALEQAIAAEAHSFLSSAILPSANPIYGSTYSWHIVEEREIRGRHHVSDACCGDAMSLTIWQPGNGTIVRSNPVSITAYVVPWNKIKFTAVAHVGGMTRTMGMGAVEFNSAIIGTDMVLQNGITNITVDIIIDGKTVLSKTTVISVQVSP